MTRMPTRLIMLGLTCGLCVGALQAQDLSQVARKTREERLKTMQQKSVRVWTNDNIPKAPAREGPTAAAGMSPATPVPLPAALPEGPPAADVGADSEAAALDSMRDKIKADQQQLKSLEERLRLEEDELSLMQVQQASELAPGVQTELSGKTQTKTAEVAAQRQAIEKAKKDLEAAEKEFKASGGTLEEKK